MADNELAGRRVLAIVTNYGVEQDELIVPLDHLRDEGAEVVVAAASDDSIQTLVGDKDGQVGRARHHHRRRRRLGLRPAPHPRWRAQRRSPPAWTTTPSG